MSDSVNPLEVFQHQLRPVGNWSAGMKKPGQKAPGASHSAESPKYDSNEFA